MTLEGLDDAGIILQGDIEVVCMSDAEEVRRFTSYSTQDTCKLRHVVPSVVWKDAEITYIYNLFHPSRFVIEVDVSDLEDFGQD